MKVIVVLPVDKIDPPGEFLGSEAVADMAQRVERLGFHGAAVNDHPCPPGRWLDGGGGRHAQDPFVMLAFVGAATTRIRLQTGILVMPYRNPFVSARAISSLDVMTGGRMIVGVGAGYLKGEYRALGANLESRNDVTDEYLAAWKAAWASEEFSFQGAGYAAVGARILPHPVQTPHPPIWIGGNSKRAIRRAVEYGDAWAPFLSATSAGPQSASTPSIAGEADVLEGAAFMRALSQALGRADPPDIVLDSLRPPSGPGHAQSLIDQLAGLERVGVSWVSIHIEGETREAWSDNLERYASEVLSNVAAP